jgi:ATP-binding cassette subfamily B protein
VAVLVFQFASAMGMLWLPRLNANIIDRGVAVGDTAYIWRTGGIMLAASFAQIIAAVIATYCAAKASMAVGRDLRNDVYHRISGFSEREVSNFGAGSLITRNTNDVQQVQMMAMTGSTMLINAPIMAIGGIVMAIRQDLELSWVIAVAVPILLVVAILIVTRMVPLFKAYQEKLDDLNRILREQLTGVRVVRAFVRETIEAARFQRANTDMMVVGRKVGSLFVLMFPLFMLILNLTVLGVMWLGAVEIDSGRIEIGTLTAFTSYVAQILAGVLMAAFMVIMVPRAEVSAGRIAEVLDVAPTLVEPAHPLATLPTPGTIEFNNVTYAFPGAADPVLQNISFKVAPGQTVAVVGSTGSGKTTLLNLITRMMDPTSGVVKVGGADVRDLELEQLWAGIGLVPQKPFLFGGTVASNVRLGKEDATDTEVWQALEIAQASDFVKEMDGGLDAAIAQGGTTVSGGQRQRLAIARAVLRRPNILLLDDSFSALDVRTDAQLRKALWQELPQITKFVVAQRVSSIMDADAILVLNNGRLTGVGTHNELMATNQTYREIAESQLTAEEAQTGAIPLVGAPLAMGVGR